MSYREHGIHTILRRQQVAHCIGPSKGLRRRQATRKARGGSASATDGEAAPPSAEANEEQLEQQGAKNALGDTSALSEPEAALGKDEAA